MRTRGVRRVIGALMVAGMCAGAAQADIYMYRDARGGLHFSNAPTQPQYRFFMADAVPWNPKRYGRIDGARRKAFDPLIKEVAQRHRVDAALVKAVIRAESDFVAHAVSPKGAQGLMQLMPATARRRGVWRAFEPRQNVEGGVTHLRYLLDRYNGDLRLALAAYNAGEGAVDSHGGVPPYRETQEYLTRVLSFRESYLREQ